MVALLTVLLFAIVPSLSSAVENEYWWRGSDEMPARSERNSEEGSWVGLGKREYYSRFTPFASIGVLSDMKQFFEDLRNNMESLDHLGPEEREALLGKSATAAERERQIGTAAYLHGLRNQRPSYKIRNFVDSSEPATHRSSNRYDPSLLWTGLGKRRS